jgi:long-chain fatty acid transport protein
MDMTNPMNPGSAFFDQDNYRSDATRNVIPSVSIAHKINENWFVGIGMFGTAGMGTDYRNAGAVGSMTPPTGTGAQPAGSVNYANFNMITNLQLMQFAVPIAYKNSGFSIALTPILQYGNLDLNFKLPTPSGIENVGNGLAQDFGFGWSIGAAYDASAAGVDGLTIGAVYKSSIEMTYDGQIANAASYFKLDEMGDTLEQPAEFGVGISYVMGQHTFAFDYKNVQWSDTLGYGYVEWEDQDVFAFGYQFTQDNWALRAGYNHATSPITEQSLTSTNSAGLSGGISNTFNALGFPGIIETHYTFGGEVKVREFTSVAFAVVYAPEEEETYKNFLGQDITVTHGQTSLSFDVKYAF